MAIILSSSNWVSNCVVAIEKDAIACSEELCYRECCLAVLSCLEGADDRIIICLDCSGISVAKVDHAIGWKYINATLDST